MTPAASIFAPFGDEEFFGAIYGRKFSRLGPLFEEGKDPPIGWRDISRIASEHGLDRDRVRLSGLGQGVPYENYVDVTESGRPRLNLAELMAEIGKGATVVIEDVARLHEPVRRLTTRIERAVRERVDSQLFLSGGKVGGFAPHYDPYDVFVLQVAGVKSWTVYEPTRPAPLIRDVLELDFEDPPVVDEFIMSPGDFIYLPRGWWHKVRPVGSPTAHLTMPVRKRTGVDFLVWLSDRLRSHELLRADAPRFADPRARARYVEDVSALLRAELTVDGLAAFFDDHAAAAPAEPWISLPWALDQEADVIPPATLVRLLAPRASLTDGASGDSVRLLADGRIIELRAKARPMIEALLAGGSIEIDELVRRSGVGSGPVTATVQELVRQGILGLIPPD